MKFSVNQQITLICLLTSFNKSIPVAATGEPFTPIMNMSSVIFNNEVH